MRGRRSTPARPVALAAAALAVLAAAGPARADDTCKPLIDAFTRFVTTPSHAYVATKGGGGPPQGEMIRTGDALYVLTHGVWVKRPTDAAEEAADLEEKLQARSATCAPARGETVNGQPTRVYTARTSTGDGTSDARTWVATATGLPVRQEIRTDDGGVRSLRFDYANVAPPAGP